MIALALLAGPVFWTEIKTTTDYQTGTGDVRLEIWKTGLRMWEANPLFGVGAGNFRWVIQDYQSAEQFAKFGRSLGGSIIAHSLWVEMLAEVGALGALFTRRRLSCGALGADWGTFATTSSSRALAQIRAQPHWLITQMQFEAPSSPSWRTGCFFRSTITHTSGSCSLWAGPCRSSIVERCKLAQLSGRPQCYAMSRCLGFRRPRWCAGDPAPERPGPHWREDGNDRVAPLASWLRAGVRGDCDRAGIGRGGGSDSCAPANRPLLPGPVRPGHARPRIDRVPTSVWT